MTEDTDFHVKLGHSFGSGIEESKIFTWSKVPLSKLEVLIKYLWENFIDCRPGISSENLTCSANIKTFIFVWQKNDWRGGRYLH